MKIVTFYSFKGGVGRSLTLLNVAYQLSQLGQRIGLIDLDIEAGGLNHILRQGTIEENDLLSLLLPTNRDLSKLGDYVLEIRFQKREQPRVFLLPTISDSNLLDQIRWDKVTERFLSDELFPTFGRTYKLDYLLIDSRSGLSEFSTFSLKIADLEVLVCRLDTQNRYGIKRIVTICKAASKPFKIVVSACPDEGRAVHVRSFEKEVEAKADVVLPYVSRLYYEETIISKKEPESELSKGYSLLSTAIHGSLNATK
jgi:MinD-like ATPase involved in chromosome partitioning or flagellar assembly